MSDANIYEHPAVKALQDELASKESIIQAYERDIEKFTVECVKAGIGDEHSPEAAIALLAYRIATLESQLAGGEAVAELWSGLNDCARELGYDFLRPEFANASRALVKYAPNNLGVHTEAPAIKQQVAQDYLLIELGHGNIEIGDGHLEGVPAIVFGRNGNGRVGEQLTFTDREMAPGETIACITFANIAGLDVLQMKMDSLRSHRLAATPTQSVSANQPDSGKDDPFLLKSMGVGAEGDE
jgi:hypothetical protein